MCPLAYRFSVRCCLLLACLGPIAAGAQSAAYDYRSLHQLQRQQREQRYDLKTRQQQRQSQVDDADLGEQEPMRRDHAGQRREQEQRLELQRQRSLPSHREPMRRRDEQVFEREHRQQDLGFKIQDRHAEHRRQVITVPDPTANDRFNH
jgi:hypothetical protein